MAPPRARTIEGYGDLFDRSFLLASSLHRHQPRKGGETPYVTHLLSVAALVGEAGGSEVEVAGALLHDAAEDCGGRKTLERIREEIGAAVADIVEGCSDTLEKNKPKWRPRKEAYIERLKGASGSVVLVSAADKLHNARCIVIDLEERDEAKRPSYWSRFRGKRDETIWYYEALLDVYERRSVPTRILRRLRVEVAAMKRLASRQ